MGPWIPPGKRIRRPDTLYASQARGCAYTYAVLLPNHADDGRETTPFYCRNLTGIPTTGFLQTAIYWRNYEWPCRMVIDSLERRIYALHLSQEINHDAH